MMKYVHIVLKILLWLLLLGLLAVGVWLLMRWRNWPLWMAGSVYGGVLAVVAAIVLLRKWLIRRREEKFVRRIIEEDEAAILGAPAQDRQHLRDLQERWKEAVKILKRSHLKRFGNPLYAIPWYVILGEPGSGKTSAIKSARLTTPLTEVSPTPGISGTRNCDWWFFDQAVFLDTAGRYSVPVDEHRDKEEWGKFLSLLARYRRREPLNGAVVAISATSLQKDGEEVLTDTAKALRRRIDEITRVMGARFPVYLLITKIDQIQGFDALAQRLPAKALDQAMGMTFAQGTAPMTALQQALDSVLGRLHLVRNTLMGTSRTPLIPSALVLPDELEELRPGLETFCRAAFEENPYQDKPFLRGLYFSSARQSGHAESTVFKETAAMNGFGADIPEDSRGMFLHDLFAKLLPRDRYQFTPIRDFLRWRRTTKGMAVTAWLLFCLAAAGMLTVSYRINLDAMQAVSVQSVLQQGNQTQGQFFTSMDVLRRELTTMDQRNQSWLLPQITLRQSTKEAARLKKYYVSNFRDHILSPLNNGLEAHLVEFTPQTDPTMVGEFIAHFLQRIDALQARLDGKTDTQAPFYPHFVASSEKLSPNVFSQFGPLYMAYLQWNTDTDSLQEELHVLRSWLAHVVGLDDLDVRWIAAWVNTSPALKPVTLERFWQGGNYQDDNLPQVDRVYTKEGKLAVDAFIQQLRDALGDPQDFNHKLEPFRSWYARNYRDQWLALASAFDQGQSLLSGFSDWRGEASAMFTTNNPYAQFIALAAEQITAVPYDPKHDRWIDLVEDMNDVLNTARLQKQQLSQNKAESLASKGQQVVQSITRDIASGNATATQALQEKVKAFDAYAEALNKLSDVTASDEVAYSLASQVFPFGLAPSNSKSPFHEAHSALFIMQSLMGRTGNGADVVWNIISGPLRYLLDYTSMEASCHLQALWEENVLAEIRDVPKTKRNSLLYDKQKGLVWTFLDKDAGPFVGSKNMVYYPRKVLGVSFPLESDFLAFLEQAGSVSRIVQDQYSVDVTTLPTNVNDGAKLEPRSTTLTLQCGEKPQRLVNYNYPASQTFTWTPATCGEVEFEIDFRGLKLTRRYPGNQGFADFLLDFRDGARRFTPKDFPGQEADLARLGVSEITARYKIRGARPVLSLLEKEPAKVPTSIAYCWK
ncbi:MAG: type VI secretion protein IcmF/TssM N-terminal domain-containing protein [Desulfovibrio sp.]|uniref:type VI secretion protein IcmF/TssM N-terminal domain-containing protein n=1 Tax=Desulfovibrio sp. 7SRBS1 TaxID=3378064 RepID=UPI003B3CF43A